MQALELLTVVNAAMNGGESWPVAKRIILYRGLAEICGSAADGAEFLRLASDLESADRRCREFAFRLSVPTAVPGEGGGR